MLFFSEIINLIPNEVRTGKTKIFKFKGKEYKVDRYGSGIVRDIYNPLPLFNNVKKYLSQRLFELFINDHKLIISKLIESKI